MSRTKRACSPPRPPATRCWSRASPSAPPPRWWRSSKRGDKRHLSVSFWDHIKPTKRPPVATKADLSADARELALTWEDGVVTRISAQKLRQNCPCAECVEEFTGRRVLDPAKVPADLKIIELAPVGNYALT